MDRRFILAGIVGVPVASAMSMVPGAAQAAPAESAKGRSAGGKYKVNIPAGPLFSNDQAQKVGPIVAAAHFGTFTGQWTTVVQGVMSVVEVELSAPSAGSASYTMDVPAGPIWSNDDAKAKCPAICASYGGTWNGQWTTVVQGKLSVAGCTFKF